jgi:hypothetical protein
MPPHDGAQGGLRVSPSWQPDSATFPAPLCGKPRCSRAVRRLAYQSVGRHCPPTQSRRACFNKAIAGRRGLLQARAQPSKRKPRRGLREP